MIELWLFVSCGAALNSLRDVAVDVIQAVERMHVYDFGVSVVLRNWDWREEPPALVGANEFAARSLSMVERSHAVVAILGDGVPRVTGREIRRAIERFAHGQTDRVWVFVDEALKSDTHTRFVNRIKRQYKVQVVYQTYNGELDFQRKLFVALTPYVVKKAIVDRRTPMAPVTGGAA